MFLSEPARVADYVRPDELHLAFNFTLLWEPWEAGALRAAIDRTLGALEPIGATPTWVLENHDVVRLATRYGGDDRARAAALLLLALPGSVFLYAGQELGLDEVDLPPSARRDPVYFRTQGVRLGRDGARVPLPWERDGRALGFTDGEPWLPMPAAWADRSVAAQADDAGSILALYRAAVAARPSGPFAWRESPRGTLVFARGDAVCAVNVDGAPLAVPGGEVLVASAPVERELPAGAAAWVRAG